VVVAPATAAFIARYATGIADDLLLNVLLATKAQVVIAPAMHTEMWQHPATAANIATLRARGVVVIEPAVGRLTGDDSGPGRLPEPEQIVSEALEFLTPKDLAGVRITIAAGGTREPIDTVRYIGNRSSGKQGLALADAASSRGAMVTLIAINLEQDLSRFENVELVSTTAELEVALKSNLKSADVVLMPAAVSDFRSSEVFAGKMSRHDSESIDIQLVANPDVLASLATLREQLDLHAKLVGFAAEVLNAGEGEDELSKRALNKLAKKNVDMIVANDVTNGAVFDEDTNKVVIVSAKGSVQASGSKLEVAHEILNQVLLLNN
jgi:phosphopantothenoylcysteine decarboxylase/phosphopantothenate--cysteine ligase